MQIELGHANAPATKLLAVYCCACHLPLVDSDSVELGIGPICRKKLAKEDVGQVPNWDLVCDSLAAFAAAKPGDEERIALFESAMLNIDTSTKRGIDANKLANVITHYVAAVQHRHDHMVGMLVDALRHMGRPALANRLHKRLYTVRIEVAGADMMVKAPFSEDFKSSMWANGKRVGMWDRDAKAYRVPLTCKAQLLTALKRAYPNTNAFGPKGEFRIEAE